MRFASHSFRASRKMPRSPRLAHKAPVIQATYTTTQIDNAKAVPLSRQLCELTKIISTILTFNRGYQECFSNFELSNSISLIFNFLTVLKTVLLIFRNANCLTYFFRQNNIYFILETQETRRI